MSLLSPITGPECPRCGCQDSSVIRRGVRWGQPWSRRRCHNCGEAWACNDPPPAAPGDARLAAGDDAVPIDPPPPDPDRGVIYHVVRCPNCGSDHCKVTSTRRPVRYHRCDDCGHTFKSVEKTP
jgi:transposase-like protein